MAALGETARKPRLRASGFLSGAVRMLRGEGSTWPTVITIGVLLALVPSLVSTYEIHLGTLVIADAIAVLGLDLIVGRAGLLSFGQAGFLAIGAYGSVIGMLNLHLDFWIAFVATIALSALVGALLALPAARLTGLAFAFITFGFGLVVEAVVLGRPLDRWTKGGSGLFTPPTSIFGSLLKETTLYWFAFGLLVVCMLIYGNLVNSRSGRALSTLRESEPVALGLGIPVQRYKMWSFATAGAFAAVAGILLAQANQFTTPVEFNLTESITLMAMLILGGTRSILGPIVGAAFFVLLPNYLGAVEKNSAIVFAAVLLVVLIVAPQGVVGVGRQLVRRLSGGARTSEPVPREGTEEAGEGGIPEATDPVPR
jgi:branched-chain amino acid transport system permease protein